MAAHNETTRETLDRIAHRMTQIRNEGIEESCPIGIIDFELWEWPQGVGLYGLWQYSMQSGSGAWRTSIRDWYAKRIADGLPERNVNTTAPMLTLLHLAEAEEYNEWLGLCREWAEWIYQKMPRTTDGGLQHIVSGHENPQQLWDDTLFMTVLFLGKAGVTFNRPEWIEEAHYQFLIHIKYLADNASGLWFHGWTFDGRHNFAKALWGRGNCWITAGTYDFLEAVPAPESVRRFLCAAVNVQVEALARLQHPSGMWHTLLDDSSSYLETSATAGFGYGILKGIRLGHLDARYLPVATRALAAVLKQVDPQGVVQQVSYGTGLKSDLEYYRTIPVCPMAYGQALSLLFLTESLHHPACA